jgi:ribosome maturation factor RimP
MEMKQVLSDCENLVSENNLELYDLEYVPRSKHLKITIINPESGTAVIDDCVLIDRAMTGLIEEKTYFPEDLTLEVSSPGLYRKLTQPKHYEYSIDQRLKLKIKGGDANNPSKNQVISGTLKGVSKNNIELEKVQLLNEKDELIDILYSDIVSAKWDPII